jgi:putative ABC transport system substrate-binding protein
MRSPDAELSRRSVLAGGFALLFAPLTAEAQAPAKVYRIGFLGVTRPEDATYALEAFRRGLRELGWVEGQNIVIEYRYADGRSERLPALAAELVGLKVDVIMAGSMPGIQAAKNATNTIPIVMGLSTDPVAEGVVASLARPGGNITGLTAVAGLEIIGKQLELLKEAVPGVRRVALLLNPANRTHTLWGREAEAAGRALGLQLQRHEVRGPNELGGVFAAIGRERASALFIPGDATFTILRGRIAELAAQGHLPTMSALRQYVEAGGLMSYGASITENFRRAAYFVDRILKGAKPADLPVEQPTKFELIINLKAAKALGITIPQSLLFRADEIIQ